MDFMQGLLDIILFKTPVSFCETLKYKGNIYPAL